MNKRDFWNGLLKISGVLCLVAGLSIACPQDSQAAARQAEVKMRSSYVVKIEAPAVDVYTYASERSEKQGQVMRGVVRRRPGMGKDPHRRTGRVYPDHGQCIRGGKSP